MEPYRVFRDGVEGGDGVVAGEHAACRIACQAVALGECRIAARRQFFAQFRVERTVDEMRAVVVSDSGELALTLRELLAYLSHAAVVLVGQKPCHVAAGETLANSREHELVDGLAPATHVADCRAAIRVRTDEQRTAADAAAENAVENGVDFIRNCAVTAIEKAPDGFTLQTTCGAIEAAYIVNAAGIHSDDIARMIGDDSISLVARKGEYYLLDKAYGYMADHTIFQCPNKMGKGVLVTPTVDGNLLIGPSALDVDDKEDVDTTAEGLQFVLEKAKRSVPELNLRGAITSFAGLRAHPTTDDFIIGFSEKSDRFVNVAGIESPGLSAAPAIAEMVYGMLLEKTKASECVDFKPGRKAPVRFRNMTKAEREALIAKNKAYGRVICRCETITEGEILDAIHAPAGARDVDGVKRRTRAGMGRCQGGFCGSKVVEILSRELGVPMNEITKFGGNSKILFEKTK